MTDHCESATTDANFWLLIPLQRRVPLLCGTTVLFLLISKSAHENTPNVFCPSGESDFDRGNTTLTDLDALAFGRGPAALRVYALGSVLRRGWRWALTCR